MAMVMVVWVVGGSFYTVYTSYLWLLKSPFSVVVWCGMAWHGMAWAFSERATMESGLGHYERFFLSGYKHTGCLTFWVGFLRGS